MLRDSLVDGSRRECALKEGVGGAIGRGMYRLERVAVVDMVGFIGCARSGGGWRGVCED